MDIYFKYKKTKQEITAMKTQAEAKGKEIISSIITSDMNQLDKELNNARYDMGSTILEESFTDFGILVKKVGVALFEYRNL